MEFSFSAPEVFLLLLMVTVGIAVVAQRFNFPTPIALVLGGMVIALGPDMPAVPLNPDLVFLIFLPPILMEAAYFTSIRDFRRNIRPIAFLAIGLVAVTTLAVGLALMWLMPGIMPAVAFTLGAIVSPPDAIAATAIARRLHVPKRVVTILEGESLVNDASGLILYKFAVAAVATGVFSWFDAVQQFIWAAIAGCAIGFGVAWLFVKTFRIIRERILDVILTFLVPYGSYVLAEMVHASGVLAVVTAGFYVSWHSSSIFTPDFRIRAGAVWKSVVFAMNGFVFILIGWQLPELLERLSHYDPRQLTFYALVISLTAVLTRLVWVFLITYGTWLLQPFKERKESYPPWQNVFVIGWTGMRGVVSLAAAMALPYTVQMGEPFPQRDLLIFLTFSFILFTLVFQGLTLPLIIRHMHFLTDTTSLQESWLARKKTTEAALLRLTNLCKQQSVPESVLQRINAHYEDRVKELGDGPNSPVFFETIDVEREETMLAAERRLWHELIEAERGILLQLRRNSEISDDVMRELEQELDLMHGHQTRMARA